MADEPEEDDILPAGWDAEGNPVEPENTPAGVCDRDRWLACGVLVVMAAALVATAYWFW